MKGFISLALSHQEKIALLETSTWVDHLSALQIATMADFFKPYSVSLGTALITESEISNFFGLLCEGQVDIVKENTAGEKIHLQTLGKGKTIGEISFFDRGPSSASVIAKTDVTLLMLDTSSFKAFCAEAPAVALHTTLNIITAICQRLRQTTGRLIDAI